MPRLLLVALLALTLALGPLQPAAAVTQTSILRSEAFVYAGCDAHLTITIAGPRWGPVAIHTDLVYTDPCGVVGANAYTGWGSVAYGWTGSSDWPGVYASEITITPMSGGMYWVEMETILSTSSGPVWTVHAHEG